MTANAVAPHLQTDEAGQHHLSQPQLHARVRDGLGQSLGVHHEQLVAHGPGRVRNRYDNNDDDDHDDDVAADAGDNHCHNHNNDNNNNIIIIIIIISSIVIAINVIITIVTTITPE